MEVVNSIKFLKRLFRKKNKKPVYTKRRKRNGKLQVYNSNTNEWLFLHMLVDGEHPTISELSNIPDVSYDDYASSDHTFTDSSYSSCFSSGGSYSSDSGGSFDSGGCD